MTPDGRFAVLATLLGIAITLLGAGLGLIWRVAVKWTRSEDKLAEVAADLAEVTVKQEQMHLAIVGQMRDDRAATNERLSWLERHLWQRGA